VAEVKKKGGKKKKTPFSPILCTLWKGRKDKKGERRNNRPDHYESRLNHAKQRKNTERRRSSPIAAFVLGGEGEGRPERKRGEETII